jgi:hypothetical protein
MGQSFVDVMTLTAQILNIVRQGQGRVFKGRATGGDSRMANLALPGKIMFFKTASLQSQGQGNAYNTSEQDETPDPTFFIAQRQSQKCFSSGSKANIF